MSNKLKRRPPIRRKCRKCGTKLVNEPEVGAVCPKCGWYRKSYTDMKGEEEYEIHSTD